METAAKGGQAKPEHGNATSFNWWFFTYHIQKIASLSMRNITLFQRQTMNRLIVDTDDLEGDGRVRYSCIEAQ